MCYRPPSNNYESDLLFIEHFQSCLDKISLDPKSVIMILGDFNAHYDSESPAQSTDFGILLHRWLECNNLFQVINEPTRITQRGATLLDLIITNCPSYFISTGTLSPPANCDHSIIYAKMNITFSNPKCYTRHIWEFDKANGNRINQDLLTFDWENNVFSHTDIDMLYEKWFECYRVIIERNIPNKNVIIRPRDKPWMTSEVRRAIRKRNRLLKDRKSVV